MDALSFLHFWTEKHRCLFFVLGPEPKNPNCTSALYKVYVFDNDQPVELTEKIADACDFTYHRGYIMTEYSPSAIRIQVAEVTGKSLSFQIL